MSTPEKPEVAAPSGTAGIVLACVSALASAWFFGFFGTIGAGMANTISALTVPKLAIIGACLGATLGGLVALICGLYLRRGFSCVFGAALGSIGGMCLSGGRPGG